MARQQYHVFSIRASSLANLPPSPPPLKFYRPSCVAPSRCLFLLNSHISLSPKLLQTSLSPPPLHLPPVEAAVRVSRCRRRRPRQQAGAPASKPAPPPASRRPTESAAASPTLAAGNVPSCWAAGRAGAAPPSNAAAAAAAYPQISSPPPPPNRRRPPQAPGTQACTSTDRR